VKNPSCDCGPDAAGLVRPGDGMPRIAGGARIVPFLEKRTYDFSTLSAGAGVTNSVVLDPALCVLDAYRVRLNLRIHDLTVSAGQSFSLTLYGALPSEEDPAQDFVDTRAAFINLSVTSATSAPTLLTATATDPDAYLRIVLNASQTSPAATLRATLSACLILRNF
jgi:hypothetical protein